MRHEVIGEFRIGEDLAVALDAVSGDSAQVTTIAAALAPAAFPGNRPEIDAAAAAMPLAVAPQADPAAGWTLSLSAAQTAALSPGLYGIDARLVVAGGVEITDRTAFVQLTRAALA